MKDETQKRLENIHKRAIVIDACSGARIDKKYAGRMVGSGLTAQVVTLGVYENFREAGEILASWNRKIRRFSKFFVHVTDGASIERAKKENKVGIIFCFQGTGPVEDEIGFVELLYKMGIRVLQLTYNDRNLSADGCQEPKDAGLSEFGVRLIKEMNCVGMVLDLSHVGDNSTLEAIDVSEKPMIISHSNARRLCDNLRNATDQAIKALADKGGVIGINAVPAFLSKKSDLTIEDYLNHMDYCVQLVGFDHVGIGLDLVEGVTKEHYTLETGETGYGGRPYKPEILPPWPWIYPLGINTIEGLRNITEGLLKRGYKEEDILKILGGNFLRVFKECWQN